MSDSLSIAELEAQHVELLPARIVLTLFSISGGANVGGNGQGAVGGVATNVGKGINQFFSAGSVFGANGANASHW
jgi:hypothetical protein